MLILKVLVVKLWILKVLVVCDGMVIIRVAREHLDRADAWKERTRCWRWLGCKLWILKTVWGSCKLVVCDGMGCIGLGACSAMDHA